MTRRHLAVAAICIFASWSSFVSAEDAKKGGDGTSEHKLAKPGSSGFISATVPKRGLYTIAIKYVATSSFQMEVKYGPVTFQGIKGKQSKDETTIEIGKVLLDPGKTHAFSLSSKPSTVTYYSLILKFEEEVP